MPHAAVNGLSMYYEEEGTGPPLILLSGATMALDSVVRGSWASLRPYLAQRYHVVQFDQRGHGQTDNPRGAGAYTLATLAADAATLIEQLGLAPAHIAGWSEGGIVGLGLALDHPAVVRSLVGIGTNYTNDARTEAQLATLDPGNLEQANPAAATMLAQRHDVRNRRAIGRTCCAGSSQARPMPPRIRQQTWSELANQLYGSWAKMIRGSISLSQ
jgi:pimeloyl-ACP methyl ester carboxylesterase